MQKIHFLLLKKFKKLASGEYLVFATGQGSAVELSHLEEVLVEYIPDLFTVVVPLGDWSDENLRFMCSGMLGVRTELGTFGIF